MTGGASGLGEASVRRLAALGANVGILDRDVEKGKALAQELGQNTAFFEMDATNEESVKKAVEATVAKFGNLWGCVNSAGIGAATLTLDKKGQPHASQVFDFVMKVNLWVSSRPHSLFFIQKRSNSKALEANSQRLATTATARSTRASTRRST